MNKCRNICLLLAAFLCGMMIFVAGMFAQGVTEHTLASNVILPQRSSWIIRGPARAEISAVSIEVQIKNQSAATTMDIFLSNPGRTRIEAELVVPVPNKAVVRSFDFEGARSEPSARLLPNEEARRLYEGIVAQTRDPAILEFFGHSLVRSGVFPVEGGGRQRVRLVYEQLLTFDRSRIESSKWDLPN